MGLNSVPFFDMFTCCRDGGALEVLLENSRVTNATVNKQDRTMKLSMVMAAPAAPAEITTIENGIAKEFGLSQVSISARFPTARVIPPKGETAKKGGGGKSGQVIMGKPVKGASTPMKDVHIDLGRVTVTGEVFDVTSREIPRSRAWVLTFDMTDYTGSVHVSKFMRDENAKEIVEKIKPGMMLTVSGNLGYTRFDPDLTLEPNSICTAQKEGAGGQGGEKAG